MKKIIGKKLNMTQVFKDDGTVVPVTLIETKDKINKDECKENVSVKVTGISKGKGFQGVVKRHGFSGSPASHGHRHDLRSAGSIGSRFPQHTRKGKRMAGHMGYDKVTFKTDIVKIEDNKIYLKGGIPGARNNKVEISFLD
ncbi:MAG: 50S ribosomal protein L3 [Patescibacteria group bacterium]